MAFTDRPKAHDEIERTEDFFLGARVTGRLGLSDPAFGADRRALIFEATAGQGRMHASALVRDGGTLQIGIGELGDAIVYCLQLRHRQNAIWRQLLEEGGIRARSAAPIEEIGGTEAFQQGLYGCSEMFVDGYLDLYRSGVLKRRVFPHLELQRLLNEGKVGERVTPELLEQLVAAGLPARLNERDFTALQHVGVFSRECRFSDGRICLPSGTWLEADLGDAEVRGKLASSALGVRLRNGVLMHGGFFLGPKGFYAALRELPESERRQFNMRNSSVRPS